MDERQDPCHSDNTPTWYWPTWAASVEWPRSFVRDTESSHGRYASGTKCITLKDLVKFHGHACDGLFRGAVALSRALSVLYPDGVVDRTALRVWSRNSPCLGDVGAYLTGARVRFGTQDVWDEPGVWYVVQRLDSGAAVRVREQPDFYPAALVRQEAALVARGTADPAELDSLREAQWTWVRTVLAVADWDRSYPVTPIAPFDPEPVPYAHVGPRTDILFKDTPPQHS
jgi:formylmethanofuran dehydrogenase subunit E